MNASNSGLPSKDNIAAQLLHQLSGDQSGDVGDCGRSSAVSSPHVGALERKEISARSTSRVSRESIEAYEDEDNDDVEHAEAKPDEQVINENWEVGHSLRNSTHTSPSQHTSSVQRGLPISSRIATLPASNAQVEVANNDNGNGGSIVQCSDAIDDFLSTRTAAAPAAEVAKTITGAAVSLPSSASLTTTKTSTLSPVAATLMRSPTSPSSPNATFFPSNIKASASGAPMSALSPSLSSMLASFAAVTSASTTTAEAAIHKWKENKDYLQLQRELGKILCSMERTPLTDWSAQASFLTQLLKTIQVFKDVVGAVELPDGDRFAKSLWRALSPQSVAGVQRKALEVLRSYYSFVNQSYPMMKDLPLLLPSLLELLPQATMQVKDDILDLLDRSVVRRMTPAVLRATAEGVLAALLSCLEESETSPMYRRAMALVVYIHATLQQEDVATAAARQMNWTSLYGAELRGSQVVPAYAWLLIRDAPHVRSPALNVVKVLMAHMSVPSTLGPPPQRSACASSDRHCYVADGTAYSVEQQPQQQHHLHSTTTFAAAEPDWVGGDVQTVVSALLNSLQDAQEKTRRLALDVLTLICPLSGGGDISGSNEGSTCAHAVHAAAAAVTNGNEGAAGMSPVPLEGSNRSAAEETYFPFSTRVRKELFSFQTRALLASAAVQLLGTRYGTPSVTRRVFQWLTVNPIYTCSGGGGSYDHGHASSLVLGGYVAESGMGMAAVSSSSSSYAYVRDITSYVLSHGFHTIVLHWEAMWTNKRPERQVGHKEEGLTQLLARRQVAADLSSLQHTARLLVYSAVPRLGGTPSVLAAQGGSANMNRADTFSDNNNTTATSTAAAALATPLVWLRALLLLFRFRSASSPSVATVDVGDINTPTSIPAELDFPRFRSYDGGAETSAVAAATSSPFLLYVAPLVLPSLSRLLVEVPRVLARLTTNDQPGGSPEEEMWTAEVRELLRVLPWTSFVQLDALSVRAMEKLMRPTLAQFASETGCSGKEVLWSASTSPISNVESGSVDHLQRRVQHYMDQVFTLVSALELPLIDATPDQPLAAQEYVRASLEWSDSVVHLLDEVLVALARVVGARQEKKDEGIEKERKTSLLSLLIATANGLLRLLVQRMQQLMEPMIDGILSTSTATGAAVVGADFFSSFLSLVETCVLRQLRQTSLEATTTFLLKSSRDPNGNESECQKQQQDASDFFTDTPLAPAAYGAEVQRLLWRLHHTTLRFTSFVTQLHLRFQQQAVVGVLLDCAAEDGAGTRERELGQQTCQWLTCLCETAAAGSTRAPIFFTRAVRLVVGVLLRARGSLLPEPVFKILEPSCPLTGGVAESISFVEKYVLVSMVHALWEGCHCYPDNTRKAAEEMSGMKVSSPDTVLKCGESLLLLTALSPACARCLDLCILQAPIDTAVRHLVRLHHQLSDMRQQQRCGRLFSTAAPESAALSELQDPGVLFLGLLVILHCMSNGVSATTSAPFSLSTACLTDEAAESARQLARAYLSQALVRDLPSILLPLYFSFLCPLVLPSSSPTAVYRPDMGFAKGSGGKGSGASPIHNFPALTFSALALMVLLPSKRRRSSSAVHATVRLDETSAGIPESTSIPDGPRSTPVLTYRYLEAAELVQYLLALLQLPTATEWVRQAMQLPTPNSLRVLLRGLEALSFTAPEGSDSNSATSGSGVIAASPDREGPSDTLFATTALLLLNLSRQSLLWLHWSCMRERDQASGLCGGNSLSSPDSLLQPEPSPHRHRSVLLDSLACLNRLLELSQTGPRMQPHCTAVHTWQFTSAQLLPLLRMAVQADLHAAQAMLLDHIRSVALYLDDVTSGAVAARAIAVGADAASGQTVKDCTCASRHWRQHTLLSVGVAAAGYPDKVLSGAGVPLLETQSAANSVDGESTFSSPGNPEATSTTLVLDDLRRAPPTVLSNKLLYAMIGEVIEHVLSGICATTSSNGCLTGASVCANEIDTLVLWLRFYCSVMPYLYRELVSSVEVVVDALLSALESAPLQCVSNPISTQVQSVCYIALAYILRFVLSVARAADVENYEAAVRTKESMSWIASAFLQNDPVEQARSSTVWTRSPVLAPIRAFLGRLVKAAVHSLRLCDAPLEEATRKVANMKIGLNAKQPFANTRNIKLWSYDNEEEVFAMGWEGRPFGSKQLPTTSSTTELREHARCLLRLLNHSAGSQLLMIFVEHWCRTHAVSSSLWVFETVTQRRCRLRLQQKIQYRSCGTEKRYSSVDMRGSHHHSNNSDGEVQEGGRVSEPLQNQFNAWGAKEAAQRAVWALLDDVGASVVDVTAALASLLRDATTTQLRLEQQLQSAKSGTAAKSSGGNKNKNTATKDASPPSRVAQLLYFVNQLIECVCVKRQGSGSAGDGLTEREAEAVLAVMAHVVSQWPPEPLSLCCILHTVYCVVAYAKDEIPVPESETNNNKAHTRGSGAAHSSYFVKAATPEPLITAIKVYQSKDYSSTLCRLLEGLSLNLAITHRSTTLLLLQLLCQTFYAVLPSSLNAFDNPARVINAATGAFQRTLLPTLRRGIASVSEAEIIACAPLVSASLQVLRAAISGFAPDLTFEKRIQRDLATLFFSENFFRYSRGALHEWTLLLRQMCAMDHEFHNLLCERMAPTPGRLSTMMMSRETEALLRERVMKNLAFYVYAVMVSDHTVASTENTAAGVMGSAFGHISPAYAGAAATAGVGGTGSGSAITTVCHKKLVYLVREQLTYVLHHFSPPATPTVVQIQKKAVFLQPLRAAFLVFRVLLMSNARESLVVPLWPLIWPELIRALSIDIAATVPLTNANADRTREGVAAPATHDKETLSPASVEALREILHLQMEALKVLDVDYTLNPAHALAFRWLFTDDAALTNLLALQQYQPQYRNWQAVGTAAVVTPLTPSPLAMLQRASVVYRPPLVSHLEVLHLLRKSSPTQSDVHLAFSAVKNAIHEPRLHSAQDEIHTYDSNEATAPVLSTIQQCWPLCARPSAVDRGLRRPLYNIPATHYPRLDGVERAAEAFTVFLQRINGDALLHCPAFSALDDAQRLLWLRTELNQCVGHYNEVDVAYLHDLVEADLTTTDPDTLV